MAIREKPPTWRRVAVTLGGWASIVLLLLLIGSVIFLVLPDVFGSTQIRLAIAWGLTVLLLLLWQFSSLAVESRHTLFARLGLRPPKAPATYIRALFNEYADHFDEHLMVGLAYAAPNLVHGIVTAHRSGGASVLVDLGCGTGICGPLFRPMADTLIGVDLAPGMLDRAEARRSYDELVEADLVQYMSERNGDVDLCIAADVLVYIGDLAPAFTAVAGALAEGGHFAFTLESTTERDWVLRRSGRYAHSRDYVRALAEENGLAVEAVETGSLRTSADEPVAGDVWLLRCVGAA